MTQNITDASSKPEPWVFNILFPLILAVVLLWPSWSMWKRARHLADVGVEETTSIVREYTKEEEQGALQGGKGKVVKTDFSVFEYGPENKRTEGEIPQRRGFRTGDTLTVIYDPADPANMVPAPKGDSLLSIFLSFSGFSFRVILALFAVLLILLGVYNLIYSMCSFAGKAYTESKS